MAKGINKFIGIGFVGQDPSVRFTPGGTAVANFSIAIDDGWKDKETGEDKTHTEWVRIVAFKKLAELIGEYVQKGSRVYVEGRLQTRQYTDKNEIERWMTEVVAFEVQFLDRKGGDQNQASPPASNPPAGEEGLEDDVPFS